jgi:SAM-dependent methyltransferase
MIVAEINKISCWNEYAKWYKLWREHNNYHDPIKNFLLKFTHRGTKILDIGAGDGILSFPLVEHGCHVTALEPSQSMQSYLLENAKNYKIPISIDSRRFEELDSHEISKFDLALACNSLHLTEYGIEGALCKIFDSNIKNVFMVTEKIFAIEKLQGLYPEYMLNFSYSYLCESSFAYHCSEELFSHWECKYKRKLFKWKKIKLLSMVTFEREHIWLKDYVVVNIFYWRRGR